MCSSDLKLLNGYDMKSGDRIRFELDHPTAFVPIFPEGADDAPKQRVKGTLYGKWFSNLSSVVSCSFLSQRTKFVFVLMHVEAYVFEGAATSVVFSKGVELTAGQIARMNKYVSTRGLGLGAVFVHTITFTDVTHNGLVKFSFSFCIYLYVHLFFQV